VTLEGSGRGHAGSSATYGDARVQIEHYRPLRADAPLLVEDVDAAFDRAVNAASKVVAAPTNQFYGDRSGGVIETSGNTIWIATHIEDVPPQNCSAAPKRRKIRLDYFACNHDSRHN
jgi:hypothetical protein